MRCHEQIKLLSIFQAIMNNSRNDTIDISSNEVLYHLQVLKPEGLLDIEETRQRVKRREPYHQRQTREVLVEKRNKIFTLNLMNNNES